MAEGRYEAPPDTLIRICRVKYLPPESTIETSAGEVILLAIRDADGLKLYAHRTYKQKVSEHDQKYIDDLLLYLLERSKDFPDEVFHQLSNLSV